jgi:hypothetical protein
LRYRFSISSKFARTSGFSFSSSADRHAGAAVLIPKPVETEDEKRHWDAKLPLAIKVITTEDFPAGRSMQTGFGFGAQSHMIYGRNELALTHHHQSIWRALGLLDIE